VGIMRIPLTRWPGHSLSIPVGLELYLKPDQAKALKVPYRSRSQLARAILEFVAEQLPERPIRSLADGGYATKDYVRQLPKSVHIVGRFRSMPGSTNYRPSRPPSSVVPRTKKVPSSARPSSWRRLPRGGLLTPAKRALRSKPGVACGPLCCLGAFCESWCSGVQPTDAPNSLDKENHLRPSKPFSPPIWR
jgi:hypothetical protein